MVNKSAILIISDLSISERLKTDLKLLGFSECNIFSSIEKIDECLNTRSYPSLVILEISHSSKELFVKAEATLKHQFNTCPLLVLTDQLTANRLLDEELIKTHSYITSEYTRRELELCIRSYDICKESRERSEVVFNEIFYSKLFELSSDGVIIGNKAGRILSANSATSKIFGYDHDKLLAMQFCDLLSDIDPDIIDQNIKHVLEGQTHRVEIIYSNVEGEQKYLDFIETRITLPNGDLGLMVIVSDITENKTIEQALKESEEKYKILVEKSNDGIIFIQEGILVYGNPKAMEIVGSEPSNFVGKSISNFLHPSETQRIIDSYEKRLLGESVSSIYETEVKDHNGNSIPVEFNANIVNYQGKVTTIVFIRDISTRKLTEKYLRESEESYRSLFDNASDAFFIQDSNGSFLDINKAAITLYGYSREEIKGQAPKFFSASDRNDLDDIRSKIKNAFNGITEVFEFWGVAKNGRIFPSEVVLNNGRYFGKDVVFAIVRDISERKNAEEVLRESEDKYRTLTEQIPVGIYRTTEDGRILYANPAFARIFGFCSVDELMQKNAADLYYNSEREQHLNSIKGSKSALSKELHLVGKDGQPIWVRDHTHITYNADGNIFYIDGVLENITEQKEANEALIKSESNLRATINAIPDLMFRINHNGTYMGFYSEHNDMYRTAPEAIIGNSLYDYFSFDEAERILASIRECLKTGDLQTIEYPMEFNGILYHYEARMFPVNTEEVLCLARDITSRKKDEEKIIMLAQTIMNVNDCISISDMNDRFIYVNPAFQKAYGYSEEELVGKPVSFVRHSSVSNEMGSEVHTQTLLGGWKGELLNIRKDGTTFPIFLSSAVIKDDEGNPIATVGISNDITERKIVERELIYAKEKAEESDRLKTAFLANMSHEIRSPMNAILGFVRFLKEEETLTENGKQYIDLITNSSKQLLSVINDIIDTSKIQANQLRLSVHEFDLNLLFNDLYVIFSSQLSAIVDRKTILLPPTLSNPSPFLITSDDLRIRQILNNLLSNAVKFTPNGYIEFGYSIVIDDIEPAIQFFVKDTGIGLPQDKQNLIFERFRQADDSYTRMYGGSGLGLAISKGLIELFGGKIWVESQEGKGSIFYFTLPLESALGVNSNEVKHDENEHVNRVSGLNWADKTFLIVEDLKEVQIFLKKMLSKTKANLIFADTAKNARLAFDRTANIDLILLDIRLPDSDDYELAVEFKAKKPEIPIIAQTAYAMQEEKERSESFGCSDYITKPIDPDLLYYKIGKLLN